MLYAKHIPRRSFVWTAYFHAFREVFYHFHDWTFIAWRIMIKNLNTFFPSVRKNRQRKTNTSLNPSVSTTPKLPVDIQDYSLRET